MDPRVIDSVAELHTSTEHVRKPEGPIDVAVTARIVRGIEECTILITARLTETQRTLVLRFIGPITSTTTP